MEELKKNLSNPFDGIPKGDCKKFQAQCAEIAKDLFDNYCIQCGEKKYFFAEVEFYYYEKGEWEKDWNNVTYARNGYDSGDLYFHLSGIDICFQSFYNETNAKFGGILIRAIKNKSGEITVGPLNCKDELLNACKGEKMPRLSSSEEKRDIELKTTYRALGKDCIDKEKDRLCFFDSQITDWTPKRNRYNTKSGKIETKKCTYKADRFK